LCGAEIWKLGKVDQKHLENFEMLCWRRMEKISWTDRVRKEEVLLRDKEERNKYCINCIGWWFIHWGKKTLFQ
jgi:hypothetical protein